ncbi:MAG TPA: thioredoxin, partial [Gemmatimonadales bacterium]|nr:thioredoxin [Gemmatimonadales bacterium]
IETERRPVAMASPVHVGESDFDAKVVQSPVPVVVDFWAEWCGPCRMIAPLLDDLSRELDGKLAVAKVDVDAHPSLAERFGVQSIPTLLVFSGGKLVRTLVGYMPKPELKKALAEAGVA